MNTTKTLLAILLLQSAVLANAQYQRQTDDTIAGYYTNPIFAGDYPDPSILREGDDYYLVNSSFEYYPGLLIWHSKDLINWDPVTNALHKYVGSVWAPDLVKYKNKYYIYFPANNTNYVVYANSINGPWSDPVNLNVGNIDPGHVTDENGNRYLFFSSGGYVPLSDDGLSVSGKLKHSYDGWKIPRDWSIECFCMEGPKLLKKDGYYYLTVAEGGTAGPATGHMVISARSKSIDGPWENSPYNPILRAKSNKERWLSKGHGTVFEDANGEWWIIFHAYEKGFYNMGRQTLLLPVEWTKDGWYKIPDGITDEKPVKLPDLPAFKSDYSLSDQFDGETLKPHWKFFGEYNPDRYRLDNNSLIVKAEGNSVANCSPLLCIPSDHAYTADVELNIEGNAVGGLVLFYNKVAYSGILADQENILANLRGWQFKTEKNVIKNHVFLRLKSVDNTVDMYYSTDGEKWTKIESSLETTGFNHNALSGFLSLRIGLVSMGDGSVTFRNFRYRRLSD
ncbi:MAG TPA: family 43 glycosylhydrolase [Bacteroidales bacterium]|nr:family 43 glycosylhydrolase [Bacteroidales bacterium]